jgi:hypothetical protein
VLETIPIGHIHQGRRTVSVRSVEVRTDDRGADAERQTLATMRVAYEPARCNSHRVEEGEERSEKHGKGHEPLQGEGPHGE